MREDVIDGRAAGKYRIEDRIAIGGMGEVFRGSLSTFDGVAKAVALKVVRADLAADEEFARLFVEEAKVAMSLSHANIVQAFDVGRIDERWFLAMEHVDGLDLGTLLRTCKERLYQPLPQRYSIFLVVEALKGLDYAHRRTRPDGTPLGIVHRDISPANILVSYEGEVKVADFGIAKSTLRSAHASAQPIQGKIPYMAPEQLRGASVDRRADLYSMGLVLYELLTGERAFDGQDELALMARVLDGQVRPPREVLAAIPDELDAIVRKAIARDPSARYASAAAMRQELEVFAMKSGFLLSSTDVADFVRHELGARHEAPSDPSAVSNASRHERTASLKSLRGVAEALDAQPKSADVDPFDAILGVELEAVSSSEPFPVFTSRAIQATERAGTKALVTAKLPEPGPTPPPASVAAPAPFATPTPHAPRATTAWGAKIAMVSVGCVALGMFAVRAWWLPADAAPPPRSPSALVSGPVASPDPTTGHPTGTPSPTAPRGSPPVAVARSSAAQVTAPALRPSPVRRSPSPETSRRNRHDDDARPSERAATAPTSSSTSGGPTAPVSDVRATLSINTDPWTYVSIDGTLVRATPLLRHPVSPGRHQLVLRNPAEHVERTLVVEVAAGENRRITLDLHAP